MVDDDRPEFMRDRDAWVEESPDLDESPGTDRQIQVELEQVEEPTTAPVTRGTRDRPEPAAADESSGAGFSAAIGGVAAVVTFGLAAYLAVISRTDPQAVADARWNLLAGLIGVLVLVVVQTLATLTRQARGQSSR